MAGPDEKPPEEVGDAIAGFMGFGGIEIPPTPPEMWPEQPLPEDVVPIAGDSGDASTDVVPIAGDSASPSDVVPIAGDGSAPPPPSAPVDLDLDLGHGRPNPFDDDDDGDDEPSNTPFSWSPWALAAVVLVAIASVAIGFFVFTSGTKSPPDARGAATPAATHPATTPAKHHPAAPRCPPPLALEHLQVGAMSSECAGPAQYKSDPRNKYYSYFAWEMTYAGRQVQLVVTGGPLHMPVTSQVSPSTAAVSSSGTKLADVDLYDNASGTKSFATSGTVRLSPTGAVTFEHVKVPYRGKTVVINGHMASD